MKRKKKPLKPKRNVTKKTRKKATSKTRPRKVTTNDNRRHGNRKSTARGKAVKRTKSIRSRVAPISVRPSKVYTRKQTKGVRGKSEVSQFRIAVGRKTKSSYSFSIGFKGGKKLSDKVAALEVDRFKQSFEKQRSKKRKLPVAFILTMTDKKGQHISETSGLDEAVNSANIIKALKRSARRKDINTDSGEKRGYKEFNPNDVVKVEVMFIYRQMEIDE